MELNDGDSIEYTSILNSSSSSQKMTLLLDLKSNGLWIVQDTNIKSTDEKEHAERSYEFYCLSTKETLRILFLENEGYVLLANNKESLHLKWNAVPQKRNNLSKFVMKHFSDTFIRGIELLKSTALSENTSPTIALYWFIPLTSKEIYEDNNLSRNKAQIFDKLIDINCNFDAQFGYPCEKDEVPSKSGKCLVIEN